ncbi:ABC transporter permease [Nisaea acidiphila]|uniref:ABC transporter permease n=2 Tax=Nisaea acidiphila TaxID=1862145 RepID=A0A9J7AYX9_9PROT|nr:ABC transporter permease [Nisaea acidiphila]UUX52286.1 ABC transporter permease [Nisaea acidiphila]
MIRAIVIAAGLLMLWQGVVSLSGTPPYILPGPALVAEALWQSSHLILPHAATTLAEILLGLGIGTLFGAAAALSLSWSARVRPWLLPVLVISQAVPVFALAPVLVLWLGYGMASKVAMAALIIFFPVTAAMFDGLRRTDPLFIDCARTLGAGRLDLLLHVRLPAALPAFASGLRVATAVAPIGAVVGEWVGSSSGLGYLMLHANARLQIDLMFAALFTLSILALSLYYGVDVLLRAAMPWQAGEARPAADTAYN